MPNNVKGEKKKEEGGNRTVGKRERASARRVFVCGYGNIYINIFKYTDICINLYVYK